MDEKFEERYKRAVAEARRSDKYEPRAESASYDQKRGRIVVELTNGATFVFPPELAEGLASASAKDLMQISITPSGDGLRFESLDVDLSLSGLLMGIFGGKRWMGELGRQGGKATTTLKIKAARANGIKGGRPRRSAA